MKAMPAIAHQGPAVRSCIAHELEAGAAKINLQRQRRQHAAGEGGGVDQHARQLDARQLSLGCLHAE
jgi:hypothetical protein